MADVSASLVLPAYCPDSPSMQLLGEHLQELPYRLVPCSTLPALAPIIRQHALSVAILEEVSDVRAIDTLVANTVNQTPDVLIGVGIRSSASGTVDSAFPGNVWWFDPNSRKEIREGLRRSWLLRVAGELRERIDAASDVPAVVRRALCELLRIAPIHDAEGRRGFKQREICDRAELSRSYLS